jgi:hypothetical protein
LAFYTEDSKVCLSYTTTEGSTTVTCINICELILLC